MWDAPNLQALQQCGLLKFYCTSNMRANIHLLETLIGYWDNELCIFYLHGEILEIIVEDIYFISGISRRGMPINLNGTGRGGDPMSVQDYIDNYCPSGTLKNGTCVPISQITSFLTSNKDCWFFFIKLGHYDSYASCSGMYARYVVLLVFGYDYDIEKTTL